MIDWQSKMFFLWNNIFGLCFWLPNNSVFRLIYSTNIPSHVIQQVLPNLAPAQLICNYKYCVVLSNFLEPTQGLYQLDLSNWMAADCLHSLSRGFTLTTISQQPFSILDETAIGQIFLPIFTPTYWRTHWQRTQLTWLEPNHTLTS